MRRTRKAPPGLRYYWRRRRAESTGRGARGMSSAMPYTAITGASGRLGGRIARRLAGMGLSQRLLVRDRSRAPQLPNADVAAAAFENPEAFHAGLKGIPTVLMVSGSETPDRVARHTSFIDAATAAGVQHLVYISFCGASPTSTFVLARDHFATEQYIRASGLQFTFVRDNLYADFLPALVGEGGRIRGPAADGRVAAVAQDDIADAVAEILRKPAPHSGATYSLTGPEALSLDDTATKLSAALGRPVTYERETVAEAYASRAASGASDWQLAAWVTTYTAIAAGELADVTEDIPRLTGHRATSLAEVLRRGSAY
jgi:NAD(P)H dehydrogenase (quinone)